MGEHETAAARTRTFSWDDPLVGVRAARAMGGLAYLQAMLEGQVPAAPIAKALDFRPVAFSEGRAVFAVRPQEFHYNPIGTVHGGLAATLLDSAMGCAVSSTLPPGVGYTTLELKVNLVRAITRETGELRCEGITVHVGGRIATAEGRLTDAAGVLYAHGTTTCLILRA